MTTQIQNINITASNVSGNCNHKCSYSFRYPDSSSVATNNGVMISLTYDQNTTSPVVYNEQKYNVGTIMIVSPSIHTFDSSGMIGEMIIEHIPVKGGNTLNVCIPFITSGDSTTASQIITEIITKVSTNAPAEGDTTNLNMSDFNLQNIIPKKPFFTYTTDPNDYIVFGDLDAIPLSSSTVSTLQQIIQPYNLATPGTNLFYNSHGPSSGISIGDGIYISCQPTGSSTEDTAVEYDKNSTTAIDITNVFNSPTFRYIILAIICILGFLGIFYGLGSFYKYISSSDSIKIPFVNKT